MTDTDGEKFDDDKLDFTLIPVEAMEAMARVLAFGAKKYSRHGYRGVPNGDERYFKAAMRHMVAWMGGENMDSETGMSHLHHALCCLAILAYFEDDLGEESGKWR